MAELKHLLRTSPVARACAVVAVLAALGPRMLALARERAQGAHPYFMPPEHTARAREILGPDAWLCPEVKVFESGWSWRYAENKGAAWSMFARLPDGLRLPLLLGVSSLAVLFMLAFVRKVEPDQKALLVALGLLMGGALGNLVDRAHMGYVVDFILWYYGDFYWPTFNVADVGISTGMGLIILTSLMDYLASRRAVPAETGVAQP